MEGSQYVAVICAIIILLIGEMYCSLYTSLYSNPIKNKNKYLKKVTICATTLIDNNFVPGAVIAFHSAPKTFLNSNVLNNIIYRLTNQERQNIRYTFTTECIAHKPQLYIVTATSIDDLRIFIEQEKKCADWKPGAHYLILATTLESKDTNEYFRLAWSHNIFKFAVLQNNITTNNIEIVTWTSKCKIERTEEIDSKNIAIRICSGTLKLFPKDISKDFEGCALRVAVNHFPPFAFKATIKSPSILERFYLVDQFKGMEIELVKYVCEMLNLSPLLLSTADIGTDSVHDMIMQDKVDVLVGDVKIKYYSSNDFSFTYPHYYDEIHAVTTDRSYRRFLEELLSIFQLKVIVAYCSIFLAALLLYIGLILAKRNLLHRSRYIGVGLTSACAITLGLPAMLPRGARSALLLLLLQWIWMSFYARTVYQSALINILSDETKVSSADTLQDLCQRNYTIIVPEIAEVRLLVSNKSYIDSGCRFARDDFVECVDVYDCLHYVLRIPSFASFISVNYFKSQKWKALWNNNVDNAAFHFIKEPVSTTPLTFQFKRGNPLVDRFSDVGLRFSEAGLMQYHLKRAIDYEIGTKIKLDVYKTESTSAFHASKFKQLTMFHVKPILQIFLGGCLLSMIVALFEIIIFYFASFNNSQSRR